MDQKRLEKLLKQQQGLGPIDRICPLQKGQSPDEKYILYQKDQEKYILRIASIKKYDKNRTIFGIIRNFHKKGVKCLKPVAFGKTSDHQYCYSIVEYLQGKSGNAILPGLTKSQQLSIGIAAGEELKKLHALKAAKQKLDWFDLRYSKFLDDLKTFNDLKLSFYKDKYVLDYLESHLDLMKGRPYRFLHNDYNVRNIIINNQEFNGIIDFDAFRWGDPLHDFYKLPWGSKSCSVWYVQGEIIGYCGGRVPDSFWEMYNFYVMLNLHRRLVWAYQKNPSRIPIRQKIIETIVKEHDLKSNKKPSWFTC